MLVFRYITKEIMLTMVALSAIILVILLSNQSVQYIGRAAGGQFAQDIVLQLMLLEIPNLLTLLLPLSFYIAVLVGLGRFHIDNEMAALNAAGVGQPQILRLLLVLALGVALLVALLVFFVTPTVYQTRNALLSNKGGAMLIKTIAPKRFKAFSGGEKVFYIQEMNADRTEAKHIFLAEKEHTEGHSQWKVAVAKTGSATYDEKTKQLSLALHHGRAYQGQPGQSDFRVLSFETLTSPLPEPSLMVRNDIRMLPIMHLLALPQDSKIRAAELNWRLSMPMIVLVLTCLALPLSQVKPRQGKFARLLPAIVIYIIYANGLIMGKSWLLKGSMPSWLGLWWVHGLMLMFAYLLYIFQKGRA